MLIPSEFGDLHLELDKVGCELVLALFQAMELGTGGSSRIGDTKCSFQDEDNMVPVVQLKSSVLNEQVYLYLRPAFHAIKGITEG